MMKIKRKNNLKYNKNSRYNNKMYSKSMIKNLEESSRARNNEPNRVRKEELCNYLKKIIFRICKTRTIFTINLLE